MNTMLTIQSAEMLNALLEEIVKNNSHCKECLLNRNGQCFFAYWCLTHDFKFYNA
jgi:hypothetical protein